MLFCAVIWPEQPGRICFNNLLSMDINILFGIALIDTGAFSAGSFIVPFGKIKGWQWETYWMVYSLGAYIILPLLACLIFAPCFLSVIRSASGNTLALVFALGAVYGIGHLSLGLALRYLGLSLGYVLSLGLMLAIATLIPPLIDGRLQVMIESSGGNLLLAGIAVAALGIAFSAWAGIAKDNAAHFNCSFVYDWDQWFEVIKINNYEINMCTFVHTKDNTHTCDWPHQACEVPGSI